MLKLPLLITLAVLILVVFLVWLLFFGGYKKLKDWLNEPVEPEKPRWTYALTPIAAALAPLAAMSALLPSYFNQQSSDKKFMQEAERNRTDSTWQKIRLDTQALSGEFLEVQTRFASPDDKTRAVAALQLGALALRPLPSATNETVDDANYPNFIPTATQLAVALQMEQNADVRAADRESLRKMIAFAAAGQNSDWQYTLANQLANSNRRLARTFTESLGRYASVNDVRDVTTLRTLATVAPFSPQPDTTMIALRDLMKTDDFQGDRRIGARLRDSLTPEMRRTGDASLLSAVQVSAARLIDSRDALADALRSLKPGDAAPAVSLLPSTKAPTKQTLKLQGCYLAGANLWEAYLGNADVTGANFTGANFKHSHLTGANLESSVRLHSSITKASQGPDKERLPSLKQKYPHFDWATMENKSAEVPQPMGDPAAEAAKKATETGAAALDNLKAAIPGAAKGAAPPP
jgi:hypothetical protein